jgi:hypothetical protein
MEILLSLMKVVALKVFWPFDNHGQELQERAWVITLDT